MIIMVSVLLQLLNSCTKKSDDATETFPPTDLQIAVFSDPHYFDPSLGITGSAFEAYLLQDRIMIAQSKPIIESMFTDLTPPDQNIEVDLTTGAVIPL
jgi:hypothetical protein